ncbi:MAG: ACP S-malonyltransferase [Vulcanibacillus sp.]
MNKIAIIFPGQGSQYVGMGKDFYLAYDSAKKIFQKADDILGYPLSKIIFEGPENDLRITRHTQPAILTTSLAIWSVLKEEIDLAPSFMTGHSLGEYSALTASGYIKFEDSINLVKSRGIFMDEATAQCPGSMAAVIGLERDELQKICEYISNKGHIVQLANINSTSQIVISGEIEGVKLASELAKDGGAKKIIPLAVNGAFHSILMDPAKAKLAPLLTGVNIKKSDVQIVMNVTGRPETNQLKIKSNLIEQVTSSVLWTDSIEWMINNGVDNFIEVGPGKVLTGLIKKINNKVNIFNIENVDSLTIFKKQLKAVNQ